MEPCGRARKYGAGFEAHTQSIANIHFNQRMQKQLAFVNLDSIGTTFESYTERKRCCMIPVVCAPENAGTQGSSCILSGFAAYPLSAWYTMVHPSRTLIVIFQVMYEMRNYQLHPGYGSVPKLIDAFAK
eukprot:scaffold321269_cov15-Tisochrysis_lutea.AAC.1